MTKASVVFRASPLCTLLLLVVSVTPCAQAQRKSSPNQQRQALYLITHVPPSPAPVMPQMNANKPVALNTAWQTKIESQSAQLLALAQELNSEVSHSNHDQISVAAVKDAEEIEKLAKSIESSMQLGY